MSADPSHAEEAPLEELRGTLERIRFERDDGAWCVAELRAQGGAIPFGVDPSVIIVGDLLGSHPGQELRMRGRWKQHPHFGRQFEVVAICDELPITTRGIEIYLASNALGGIGEKLAQRLTDRFGLETLDVIANQPERLREVEGIGPKRAERIAKAWGRQAAVREVMLFLNSLQISTAWAGRIIKAWGEGALSRIQRDPYALARDVHGIGFATADRIARNLGFEGDDPRRVRAGVHYVLREAAGEGHLYLPTSALEERAAQHLSVPLDTIRAAIEHLAQSGQVILEPVTDEEAASGEGHLAAFPRLHHEAELRCAAHLRRLLTAAPEAPLEDPAGEVERAERAMGLHLADAQRRAIQMATEHNLLVITGGPGTGKTTLVRAVVQIAEAQGWRTLLAAPTGRAARRMSEATGQSAETLHRLLKFSFQEGGFQRNAEAPLLAELLVVDEASMIDIHLLSALLAAVPTGCRLLLVGDVDQLPSVGPGDVLAELIRSEVIPVCRLTSVFRQAEASAIVRNAHRINQGMLPESTNVAPTDFYLIPAKDAEDVVRKTLKVVTERVPQAFGFDPTTEVQVIAPMHRGPVGCQRLNEALQSSLNARVSQEIRRGGRVFRPGDRVMQLRNDYDREVFNGDIGYVVGLTTDESDGEALLVDMDGRQITYGVDDLDALTLAYAITAHKSQGSEYPVVVIALATAHYVLLERNLLYTALTRARRLAIIIAMEPALGRAARNFTARRRFTRLAARLQP